MCELTITRLPLKISNAFAFRLIVKMLKITATKIDTMLAFKNGFLMFSMSVLNSTHYIILCNWDSHTNHDSAKLLYKRNHICVETIFNVLWLIHPVKFKWYSEECIAVIII